VFFAFQYNYGRPPRVRQVQPDQSSQGGAGFPPPWRVTASSWPRGSSWRSEAT